MHLLTCIFTKELVYAVSFHRAESSLCNLFIWTRVLFQGSGRVRGNSGIALCRDQIANSCKWTMRAADSRTWLVIPQEVSGEGHFMNAYYCFKVLHREAERKESKMVGKGVFLAATHMYQERVMNFWKELYFLSREQRNELSIPCPI